MFYSFLRNGRTELDEDTESFLDGLGKEYNENDTLAEKNFSVLESYLNELSLPKSIDFESLFITAMEAKVNGKERSDLPDSAFGLRKKRQYPLTDPELVRNAIKYFKYCGKNDRAELAANIIEAVKKFKMKPVITPHNPIRMYMKETDVVIGSDKDNISKDKEVDKNKYNSNPVLEADTALKSTTVKSIKKTVVKKVTEYYVNGESIYREPKGEELLKIAHGYTKATSGALSNVVEAIRLYCEYSKACKRLISKFKFTDDDFVNNLTRGEYSKYSKVIDEFKADMKSLDRDKDAMIKKSSSGAIVNINKETIELYIKCIQSSNENISSILNILLEGGNEKTLLAKSMYFSEAFISAAKSINEINESITKNFR